MAKIVLDTVTGGYDLSVINNNFDKIETELQNKVMYRNNPIGEPNTFETDVDANAKRIYNLPAPTIPSEAARLQDIQGILNGLGSLIQFTPYKNIAAINLQNAIQEEVDDLESTAGAGLIGLTDAGGKFAGSTVEAALSETRTAAELSASNGSSLVSFLQSGTGGVSRSVQSKLRDYVNVKDFGAVGDGVTDDTAAFLSATTASPDVLIPPGTYLLDAITFPTTLKNLVGSGSSTILKAKASLTGAATTWISFNFQSDLTVSDFSINISSVTHPTVVGMQFGAVDKGLINNVNVIDGGRFPFFISASGGIILSNSHINAFAQSAVVVDNVSSNIHIEDIISTPVGTGNSIVITGGSYNKISNCYVGGAGTVFFSIALIGTTYSVVENCIALGTILEAIQITDGSHNTIKNNIVICGGSHNDFGISVFGDTVDIKYNVVVGNTVIGSGGSGIGVSASFLTPSACLYTNVSDNLIVSCNTRNDVDGAGVYLLGGALCQLNTVKNNIIIDEGNRIRYGAYESNSGGTPNNNKLIHNTCYGGAVFISEGLVVGAQSEVYDLRWNSFATTVTSQTGTITTVNTALTYLKYKRVGRSALISGRAAITTNGTGASSVQMTLPFTIQGGTLYGRENGVSGAMLQGYSGGANLLRIATYTPAYPGADGAQCLISGTVEI